MNTNTEPCLMTVEIDRGNSRFWSAPMLPEQVNTYIASYERLGYWLSDVDHSTQSECDCYPTVT